MSIVVPILTAVTPIISDLIDRAFPNSEKRELARLEIMTKMQEQLNALDLAQMEVNKAEASNSNLFVAGWRPFIGWVCGLAFAYHFILQPLIAFVLANAGVQIILPVFDMEVLNTVLMGMLGLGGLRTVERMRGVERNELPWRKK